MGNRAIVGTPIKVVLDGNLFNPAADADPGHGKPRLKTEAEMTSGRTFFKKTVQSQEISSMTVKVTGNQLELLKALAERLDPFPMSYTNAAEETYRAQGMIDYDDRKAATGAVDLALIPDEKGWTLF